jgi:hypothetical protein
MTASRARNSDIGSDLEKSRIGIRRSRGCALLPGDLFCVIVVSVGSKIDPALAPHKSRFDLPSVT